MTAILRIIFFTAAFAVLAYSVYCEYRNYLRQLEDDKRNALREVWMRRHVQEAIAHEEEFARYKLMRDAEKIKF